MIKCSVGPTSFRTVTLARRLYFNLSPPTNHVTVVPFRIWIDMEEELEEKTSRVYSGLKIRRILEPLLKLIRYLMLIPPQS